jgi:predicted small secreted protein
MENKSTKTLLAALLLISLFVFSGCNTVKGIGEDFESMGESIQNAGN